MKFKATEEQVKQMACNAINNSGGVGLGMLHYKPEWRATPDLIKFNDWGMGLSKTKYISIDYIQGRMVKFTVREIEENLWETTGNTEAVNPEYQSWHKAYPTFKDLCDSVGAEIINEVP